MLNLSEISPELIRGLVLDIDRQGFAVLPGFLSRTEVAAMQAFVRHRVDSFSEQAGFSGSAPFGDAVLGTLTASPAFLNLFHRLYREGTGQPPPAEPVHQHLRCLTGAHGLKNSLIFHYDSYVLTAILPITIPPGETSGDLLLIPNFRPLRRSYFRNLLDKLLVDNRVTQAFLNRRYKARRLRHVSLNPGDLYFIWGYRTIHCNAPCDPKDLRATAIFHYASPHRHSALRDLFARAKQRSRILRRA